MLEVVRVGNRRTKYIGTCEECDSDVTFLDTDLRYIEGRSKDEFVKKHFVVCPNCQRSITKYKEMNQEEVKFTRIYLESWVSGSHMQTMTRMVRITRRSDETVKEMLERIDPDTNTVFLFKGWPKLDGEE